MVIIALVLLVISLLLIFYIGKKVSVMLIHVGILLLTPWAITLFLGKPTLTDYLNSKPAHLTFIKSIAFISSTDFLFFKNFTNLQYAVGDYGNFLPSFIPLITTGLWCSLTSKKLKERGLVVIFLGILVVSSLLYYIVGYLSVSIFNVFLSFFATFGFLKFVSILKEKRAKLIIKSLIYVNFLLIIYESLMLYHSLNIQIHMQT